jgi:D-alanyl-D-alanine carboxypeptidase (penicillin-binding protein 5/6)
VSPLVFRRLIAAVVVAGLLAGQAAFAVLAEPRLRPPPPTPVNGRPSAFPSVLETPADGVPRPEVDAAAALLADLDTGDLLFSSNPDVRRPVASLTKVMTALVTLRRTDPQDVVRVDPRAVFDDDDFGASSTLGLRSGERITVEDLLYALLLGSANDAANALAYHVAGTLDRFLGLMNATADRLGMRATVFFSANGLDDRGRSTARDQLTLVRAADADPLFRTIVATRFRTIPAPRGEDRRIQNRNALLWLYPGAIGTKTGLTAAARFCLIGAAERDGRRLVAIVLGSPGEPFSAAATLLNHGFEGYTQTTLVDRGDPLGSVRIRGGTVPVVAGSALDALVPTVALEDVATEIVVDPDAAYPPAPGERVATLTVEVPGLALGSVPLVVPDVPPPPAVEGPWWARTFVTVVRAVGDTIGSLAGSATG